MKRPNGYGASEEHASLLAASFERLLRRPLLAEKQAEESETPADRLFHAPFVLLSHGTEPDPVLNYGNLTALTLWEMDWADFTRTPSRLTAEPALRAERDAFMRQVAERGYADNYSGIRVSSAGRRFRIRDAIVWNLTDADGAYRGQAALIQEYDEL